MQVKTSSARGDAAVPLEVGLWRVDGSKPVKMTSSGVPLEAQLEQMIEADPTILGTPLLLIGRQVGTEFGKYVDLLALDDEGALHVLELKREKTPREVVAQVLDYGAWIQTLSHDQVLEIYTNYKPGTALEQAWTDAFGGSPPDELNAGHRLTVIASDVDAATERIVDYLAGFDVPVNVVFFRYFHDDDRAYLARTWLLDEARTQPKKGGRRGGSKEAWNEQDWYVSFGEETSERDWDDARKFGFVSAGGGEWFSKTLKKLPLDARVFVCIPKTGYVGVGTVTGPPQRFVDATVTVNGEVVKLSEQPLTGDYLHPPRAMEDTDEYVVPVSWITVRPREQAVWEKGMFANQNSACKLRNKFTLERLVAAFDLEED